jgi:hypothetical protein
MSSGPAGLKRQDLPATGRSASGLAARGQRRTKRLVQVELLALIAAGLAGLTSLRVGPARLDVFAGVSALCFLLSLGASVYRGLSRTEQVWYAGRAAAESVRTTAWRYAVGGDPYPNSLAEDAAGAALLDRLRGILGQLREFELPPVGAQDSEITAGMRALRAASLDERRAAYKRDRVSDQITWYTDKASHHERAARRWLGLSIAASLLGVVTAGLRMFGVVDLDLLGVAGACASAAVAWNQLNQNRNLVAAYRVTARELSMIRDRIDGVGESEWPRFVSDGEEAISREHTLWLARHGHPGIRTS